MMLLTIAAGGVTAGVTYVMYGKIKELLFPKSHEDEDEDLEDTPVRTEPTPKGDVPATGSPDKRLIPKQTWRGGGH